jgi:hypothetical protein
MLWTWRSGEAGDPDMSSTLAPSQGTPARPWATS